MGVEWVPGVVADTGAAPGLSVPILVGAGVVLIAGLGLRAWTGARWALWGGLVAALVLGGAAFAVPRLGGEERPDAEVVIVQPSAEAEVPAGEPVTVEVTVHGGRVATSPADEGGGHLHLYVDGDLQQMPYSEVTEVTLQPGPHTLRVEYVDHDHISFEPEIDASLEVTAG